MKVFAIAALAGAVSMSAFAVEPVKVDLKNAKGDSVGTATLTQLAKGVKIQLDVKDIGEGEHAFHIHENGTCTAPDFKSAGGHFNPMKHKHGYDVAGGVHAGDMPNLIANDDGEAKLEYVNPNVTLKKGAKNSLLKKGGTALVIHAKPDDYKSQPAGEAGDRIACGEIKAK